MILWSRGFYKTTSVVCEIVQLILNFPDIRILLMQGTVLKTKELLKEIKSHFDGTNLNSQLKDIFPEFCVVDKKLGTAVTFTVPNRTKTLKDGTVTVASPKTIKAGQHYDAGFFDDLIHEQNYKNPRLVLQAIKDFNMYTPLIDPGGYRYVTGTRYTFGDLYEWILRKNTETQEWHITVRPCWVVNEDGSKTSLFPPRKLTDGRTVGFSVEHLESIQREDAEMFAAQYLNQPISVTAQLFPEELMLSHVRSTKEENFPGLGYKTLFIDLAASKNSTSDHSVILCGQQDSMTRIYVTDGVGGQWSPTDIALVVIEQALKHKPIRIYIEKSAAGVYFVEYLKKVALDKGVTLPIDFIKVDNQSDAKHLRISLCSGFLKQNKLFFLQGLPCWTRMFEEFTTYPRTRHDDYPDTCALMCQHYQATAPLPKVKSLASYLFSPEVTPVASFILNRNDEANQDGGSMGGVFE